MTSTEADPVNLAPRQAELLDLLANHPELSPTEIMAQMGISKAWMYQLRDRLTALGVFYPVTDQSTLANATRSLVHPQDTMASPHHAAVRHSSWDDDVGLWGIQGALLNRWDRRGWPDVLPNERVIVVRLLPWKSNSEELWWSWVASRRQRWTLKNTWDRVMFPALSRSHLVKLTCEIAWALEVDAVIPPEAVNAS